jgi:quercetin dioxygenase-like cupin family protein
MSGLAGNAGRKVVLHQSIIRGMRRIILSFSLPASFCAMGLLAATLCAAKLSAQSGAVSINNEPHHKRLLYTNDLRLWDVMVPAGQATSPFVHEYDVATVVIGDGTLNIQRNGEALSAPAPNARGTVIVAEHTGVPATYRIENSGTTDYRAFEIENMREGGSWPSSTPFTAPGSSVLKESRAFTLYDLQLKAGAPEAMHQHTGSTIIVLISGTLEQGGIGGEEPVRVQQPGQWLALPRFQGHTVVAVGNGDAHAIEIEVR